MKKTILLLIGMCSLYSCGKTGNSETQSPHVKVVQAEKLENESTRSYTFISQPFRTTELSFRVGGPVHVFDVQNGQFFRKGELIAAIDDRDFIIRKQRAEALYKQAEADYKRISNLYEQGNISGMNYEKAKADYEKAKADHMAATNDLNDTRLYAPFDGYVQKVNIERYQDVKPSFPVVTFIDLSKIKAEIFVPEDIAAGFRQKEMRSSCSVCFNAFPNQTFTPVETYLTQSAADNNISYQLTAILDNTDSSLLGGMTGSLSISCSTSSSSTGVVVPQTAVCHNNEIGSFVWRVDGQEQVNQAPVTVGKLRKGNKVEILSGLAVGDKVAVTRLAFLSEHDKIVVQE